MALDLTSKRILITGGTGFLGRHLVTELRRRECSIVFALGSAKYDLRRWEETVRAFGYYRPEVVIHCAAVCGGIGANSREPGRFFHDNLLMGLHVIEAARLHGVQKVVIIGTTCSYPRDARKPFREEDLWNGYPEETNAPYGIAKKTLLVQCQAYRQQYGLNGIFLLPANLYGPGDNFDLYSSHVIPAMIRKFAEPVEQSAPEVILWGDGSPTREFLFVADAAEAIVLATERYDKPEPVNLGTGQEISIRELAGMISALTGFGGKIVWDTTKPNGQPRRCLDITRAECEFGFRARTRLWDGLKETVKWYLKHRK